MPGEGEAKIFDHIKENKEGVHCVFGNDADLIMLGLVNSAEIYILRETLKSSEEKFAEEQVYGEEVKDYEYFGITALKNCLKEEVQFED